MLREKIFDNIWIQPASGDAGCALGAALAAWHLHYKKPRKLLSQKDAMKGSYLGPEFSNYEIEAALDECGAVYCEFSESDLIDVVASALAEGKAGVGCKDKWNLVQGRLVDGA